MSQSLNQVEVIGYLTADPIVKETPSGQKVANFSVATSRKWKDANGETVEDTEFHNIVVWRKLAEIVEQYVTKGTRVFMKGYLKTRSYEKEYSGEIVKFYRTEIIADEMIMLSSKDRANTEATEAPVAPKKSIREAVKTDEISIEDIPF